MRHKSFLLLLGKRVHPGGSPEDCCRATGILTVVINRVRVWWNSGLPSVLKIIGWILFIFIWESILFRRILYRVLLRWQNHSTLTKVKDAAAVWLCSLCICTVDLITLESLTLQPSYSIIIIFKAKNTQMLIQEQQYSRNYDDAF